MGADEPRAEEAAFVARLKARDEAAFTELMQLYQQRVFALVFRMLGRRSEAEEVTQETFVQVFRYVDGFRGDAKLSTWIFRVAVNLSKNRMKRNVRRASSAHQDLDSIVDHQEFGAASGVSVGTIARPDDIIAGVQLEQVVKLALDRLDPEFRRLVVLRDVEDLTYEEIAEVTGLPRGTVKSRIHRGRVQLREEVEQTLGERIGGTRATGRGKKDG
ncbi:MAG: sigma-70 family RNA polymerase sigma factor [Myxococcota bacterium]